MKQIPLSQGKVALVDDEDYEYLSQWNWYASKPRHVYYAVKTTGGTVYMHQMLAERMGLTGTADHIDRDGLNNQRSNLRSATPKQQAENQRLRSTNTSGHKGVCRDKGRWKAHIRHNGKHKHLGYFDTVEEAAQARAEAEKEYFTHS